MQIKIYEYKTEGNTYDVDENGEKIESTKEFESSNVITETHIFADEGKVFKRISDGEVLTAHIGIGSWDSVENYEEVDADVGTK